MVWKRVLCGNPIIRSLDFVANRLFMKLFQNNNIDIVNYCRAQFEFDLPSTVVEKRSKKFVAKYRSCETAIHLHNLFHCCCCCLSFFVLLSAVLFLLIAFYHLL